MYIGKQIEQIKILDWNPMKLEPMFYVVYN